MPASGQSLPHSPSASSVMDVYVASPLSLSLSCRLVSLAFVSRRRLQSAHQFLTAEHAMQFRRRLPTTLCCIRCDTQAGYLAVGIESLGIILFLPVSLSYPRFSGSFLLRQLLCKMDESVVCPVIDGCNYEWNLTLCFLTLHFFLLSSLSLPFPSHALFPHLVSSLFSSLLPPPSSSSITSSRSSPLFPPTLTHAVTRADTSLCACLCVCCRRLDARRA